MTRTLLVTPAEVAAGWIVRPGDLCHSVRCAWSGPPPWPDDCRCKGQMQPPADLVAAAAPCETCVGSRLWWDQNVRPTGANRPCPDCRIALLGECLDPECDNSCGGTVTLGYAYPVGDVLPIVGDGEIAGDFDYIEVVDGGEVYVWRWQSDDDDHVRGELVVDDVAWEAFRGQYALQIVLLGA